MGLNPAVMHDYDNGRDAASVSEDDREAAEDGYRDSLAFWNELRNEPESKERTKERLAAFLAGWDSVRG